MTVTLFVSRLGAGSGTAGVAQALSAGLAQRGHRVRVVCRETRVSPPGVEVLPWQAPRKLPRVGGEVRIALDRLEGCDVVRASGGVHRMWSRVGRTSVPRWLRSWSPAQRAEARHEARAIRSASTVVCNSLRAAGEVQAWYGLAAGSVRVIRNGVDLARFAPSEARRSAARAHWGASGRVALFVGHGWFRKGFAAAVAAFAAVSGAEDRLVVIGRDARSEGRAHRARAQLGSRLIVQGPDDPAQWLPGADVLVHPTRYDASANVVLEALAAGVPPVTTLRDGAAEILQDRSLVVGNPDDVQGIARAVRYAWEHPELRERCRAVATNWPTSRMVLGFETILKELGHGRKNPGFDRA